MKKNLLFAAAIAGLISAASCQQENLEPMAGGDTVTYTVQMPASLQTKAFGEGYVLNYEVYRAAEVGTSSATPVYESGDEPIAFNNAGIASFDLEFVKNQKFVVLFWAQTAELQNAENPMFDITDLRNVQLVNCGKANNPNAAVFAGKDVVENCVSTEGGAVELVRPISQLNIYTTKESLEFGTPGISLVQSSVTVSGLYKAYNVATGEAKTLSAEPYVYTLANVPQTADADQYAYVAMSYVGFADQENTVVDVDFSIKTYYEANLINHSVANVPVRPNYRTNIVGNLLTAETDYNVTLASEWAGSTSIELFNAETAEEFAQAVTVPNAHVIVPENTTYTLPATIAEGVTIVGSEGSVIDFRGKISNYLKNATFKGVTIKEDDIAYNGIQHSESVSFVDCIIDGSLWSYANEATFRRCTFKNQTDNYPLWIYASSKVVLEECHFETQLNKGVLILMKVQGSSMLLWKIVHSMLSSVQRTKPLFRFTQKMIYMALWRSAIAQQQTSLISLAVECFGARCLTTQTLRLLQTNSMLLLMEIM